MLVLALWKLEMEIGDKVEVILLYNGEEEIEVLEVVAGDNVEVTLTSEKEVGIEVEEELEVAKEEVEKVLSFKRFSIFSI